MNKKKIVEEILDFVFLGNPTLKKKEIPLNKSLLKLGILDSYGVIELVTYIEKKYKITIENNELTTETFGSIKKMSDLVAGKIKISS